MTTLWYTLINTTSLCTIIDDKTCLSGFSWYIMGICEDNYNPPTIRSTLCYNVHLLMTNKPIYTCFLFYSGCFLSTMGYVCITLTQHCDELDDYQCLNLQFAKLHIDLFILTWVHLQSPIYAPAMQTCKYFYGESVMLK